MAWKLRQQLMALSGSPQPAQAKPTQLSTVDVPHRNEFRAQRGRPYTMPGSQMRVVPWIQGESGVGGHGLLVCKLP